MIALLIIVSGLVGAGITLLVQRVVRRGPTLDASSALKAMHMYYHDVKRSKI